MNILKNEIWIADLSHTEQGIVAGTFPLGVSCVYSYAKKNWEMILILDFLNFHQI